MELAAEFELTRKPRKTLDKKPLPKDRCKVKKDDDETESEPDDKKDDKKNLTVPDANPC